MRRLSEDAMYQAVVSNDQHYDGIFFYAVKTTGIVCRPSCRSKVPKRDNIGFFSTLDEALQHGYRPCKRCRPDLGSHYGPEKDVVQTAYDMINQEYADPELLAKMPTRLGISSSQLQRLFKKAVGCTPRAYLRKLRITKAAQLIQDGSTGHLDISLAVGFASLSSFYAAFRGEIGLSPREYRRNNAKDETNRSCDREH